MNLAIRLIRTKHGEITEYVALCGAMSALLAVKGEYTADDAEEEDVEVVFLAGSVLGGPSVLMTLSPETAQRLSAAQQSAKAWFRKTAIMQVRQMRRSEKIAHDCLVECRWLP